MSKYIVGVGFCLIAAILYAARCLCAAVLASRLGAAEGSVLNQWLAAVGPSDLLIGLSLLIGVACLLWAELQAHKPA